MATIFKSSVELRSAAVTKLEASGLTPELTKKLQIQPVMADKAVDFLDAKHPAKGGILIPYFTVSGKPTKFWRFRYLERTLEGFAALTAKKDIRYVQASGSLNELYFPPLLPWIKVVGDPSVPICITEGELKAACGCAYFMPTIGLGGVWNFRSTKAGLPLLPQFQEVDWKDRNVYIIYDSDAKTNPNVLQAENALAEALTALEALPHIVRLPEGADGKKQGLDDFLVTQGKAALERLTNAAQPYDFARELHKFNEEVVYVRDPGVVLRLSNQQRINPRAFVDHAYSTRTMVVTTEDAKGNLAMKELSLPKEWLKWPGRAEVERVTYVPGGDRMVDGALNSWPGWGVAPKAGDIKPWQTLMDYIFFQKPDERHYFEQWLACPLQHPGIKMSVAAVIHGIFQGTGKTLVGETMFKIYGRNATEITNEHLGTSHNEWAENKQFIMGSEITGGDKRAIADTMKQLITQKRVRINIKFIPSYELPDCANYYFSSNHPDSFFLEDNDRRYFVHEVNSPPLSAGFYTETYVRWLNGDGPAALFDYLLKKDLTGFHPHGAAMMTDAKRNMISVGRSDLAEWVNQLKEAPHVVLKFGDSFLDYALWTTAELVALYDPLGRHRVTANGMGRELRRSGFVALNEGQSVGTARGSVKLFAIRDFEAYAKMSSAELAQRYAAERGAEIAEDDPAIKRREIPLPTGRKKKF